MFQKLETALAQTKSRNTSKNSLNENHQIIYNKINLKYVILLNLSI